MANYYFLGALLPELTLDHPPEINFEELQNLFAMNLTESDMAKVRTIRRYIDFQNIGHLWQGEALDPYGEFDKLELEDILLTGIGMPSYVIDYLESTSDMKDPLQRTYGLLKQFFEHGIDHSQGFVRRYLKFEQNLRFVLAGIRAKKLGRDLLKEFQYQDPEDQLIAQIIAQKDVKSFEPPEGFEEIKEMMDQHEHDPIQIHKAIAEFRMKKIDEMLGFDQFSIDCIIAYFVKLIIVEKWQALDKKQGSAIVENILKELS